MRMAVIAYFDKVTEKFNPAILAPNTIDDAIEMVIDGVKKGTIKDANDFDLYVLGEYITETGTFELNKEPKKVCELYKYVREK